MKLLRALLPGVVAAALANPAPALLELASPFTEHAVLQRDVAVPIWGTADEPGSTVIATFGDQTRQTIVNTSGGWRIDLDAMPANATGGDLVITHGNESITLHDVVVGEVWLASGQSNMEWPVRECRGYDEEKARPANPLIRHLRVDHVGADLPATRVKTSGWKVAAPDTVGDFSGTGYFFAQAVAARLHVPVGILHSSWGGTAIESWIPEPILRQTRSWPALQVQMQEAWKVFPKKYAEQPALEKAWELAVKDHEATGKPLTMEWPRPPIGPGSGFAPARLYNAMLAPLVPYALRGALWYQGESNTGRAREYADLLPAMIQSWRASWPLGDFPFLVVQLPGYENGNAAKPGWAFLREAQAAARRVPATGVAVMIDAEEKAALHPTNKRQVGERLAAIALRDTYGDGQVAASGPALQSWRREGDAMRLQFTHADGLRSTRPTVTGFQIAGADRVWHAADASLQGSVVVLRAAGVAEPVAARYAFMNAPETSLVNADGLPAEPFRTDDW